ncbi:MAG: glycosyltransferase, partial [Planctomycetota bacterium]
GDRVLRALVIAPEPFFTPRGTPLSVYHRAVVATELGVEVDLLTYGEGEDVDVPGLHVIRTPHFSMLGAVRTGPSGLKLFLDQFMMFWTLGLLLRRRYDFVHAHEEAVFFCLLFKPFFRFKLVYDMHSRLPEQLDNFAFTSSQLVRRVFQWLESRALRSAEAVITICPELAAYATSQGVEGDRHFLIENSIFEPVRLRGAPSGADARVRAVQEHLDSLPADAPLVVYAGTLECYQGIDLLLAAFERLHARVPGAQLLVLGGDSDQRRRYEDAAKSLGVQSHSLFAGRVPQDAAKRFCLRATVQVSPRSSGTNTPLKLYQQLASGIPIVATRVPSHTQVLDESVTFLADPEPGALADALELALRDPELRARKAANARRLYEARYSKDRYVQKMSELLKGL